uniref:Uncharacterized protein n=1 Tax=Nicotiana tabacum TaxID=4097 RepID=A0A1S3ZAC4_TOBAC|nr:PREDICTED: uncharacterized protein LOC107784537 [Nicotiana tabacum]
MAILHPKFLLQGQRVPFIFAVIFIPVAAFYWGAGCIAKRSAKSYEWSICDDVTCLSPNLGQPSVGKHLGLTEIMKCHQKTPLTESQHTKGQVAESGRASLTFWAMVDSRISLGCLSSFAMLECTRLVDSLSSPANHPFCIAILISINRL